MIAMFKEGRGGKGWSGDFYNTETIVYEAMVVDTWPYASVQANRTIQYRSKY